MDNRFYMCLILLVSITFTEKNSAQDSLKTSLTFDQAVELTFQQSHVVKQSNYFKEQKETGIKSSKRNQLSEY
jgi:uncharacterized DUF497 family protein